MRYYKKADGALICISKTLNLPEITQEEYDAEMAAINERMQGMGEVAEHRRSLTRDEVADIILKAQVNTVEIDDQTSVRMKEYYPAFETLIGQTLKQGYKLTHGGDLYKTAQEVTVQEIYLPGATGTESLYTRIDMDHLGNKYDPIPYAGNMELTSGKYYTQDDVLYVCTRDTGAAVHHALADLVGIYVETA